ncbi:hypothetical protein FACS1894122_02200 [Alphaproteobacteria bacterium]|nr:hypothetical protein FACS1894122_02200 [Alphaproteobacteria bacterium]
MIVMDLAIASSTDIELAELVKAMVGGVKFVYSLAVMPAS